MALDKDQIRNVYVNRNKMLKKTFDSCGFILKYDYTKDEKLDSIANLVGHKIPDNYQLIDKTVDSSFLDNYLGVLSDFGNEKLYDLMNMIYLKTNILKNKDNTIEDCYMRIGKNEDNEITYSITSPDQDNTSLLYASYIHELFHFPLLTFRKNKEYYEYSEVISLYFEYLMYEKLFPKEGYDIFINNRLNLLDELSNDFCDDLLYRRNYFAFDIPVETFSIILAEHLSYYDGVEYVLNLIELSKNDPKEVKEMISKVLFDESSCRLEAEKHNIDTSNYSKIMRLY